MRISHDKLNALESLCAQYQEGLTDEAVSYLAARGLSEAAIVSYRLGVVADIGEHSMYRGMLSIPYLTELAGVVGFKFRQAHACTDECRHSKYLTPYPTRLYNPKAFTQGERLGYIGICEGEFDAIINTHMVGIPTVGVPGVDSWTQHKEWPLLFQGFGRVLVFRDADEPGLKLAKRILSDVPTAHLVDFEGAEHKDITDLYLNFGAEAIREVAGVA